LGSVDSYGHLIVSKIDASGRGNFLFLPDLTLILLSSTSALWQTIELVCFGN